MASSVNIIIIQSGTFSAGTFSAGIFAAGFIIAGALRKYLDYYCCHDFLPGYPLTEFGNGLLYLLITNIYGLTMKSIVYCACSSVLAAISIIDWQTFQIPAECNLTIGILGGIRMFTDRAHWTGGIWGSVLIGGLLFFISLATAGEGIGGGDAKLMTAAGLVLGWPGILLSLFIGSLTGVVIHGLLMRNGKNDHRLALGPYLSFGIFMTMISFHSENSSCNW